MIAVPWGGSLTAVVVIGASPRPVSLARTGMITPGESSATVALSATATGTSLTGVTVIATLAVDVWPSASVTV